jgi:hypothetical protein
MSKTIAAVLVASTCLLSLPAEASVSESKVGAFSISFMGIRFSLMPRYYAPRRHYSSNRSTRSRSTPRNVETRSVEKSPPSTTITPADVDNALRPSRVTVPAS